jgi:hypothetical protein
MQSMKCSFVHVHRVNLIDVCSYVCFLISNCQFISVRKLLKFGVFKCHFEKLTYEKEDV